MVHIAILNFQCPGVTRITIPSRISHGCVPGWYPMLGCQASILEPHFVPDSLCYPTAVLFLCQLEVGGIWVIQENSHPWSLYTKRINWDSDNM